MKMQISIQDKLKEKEMTRYKPSKRIGVTYPTIDNIYKGTSTSIKPEILEAICLELDCSPTDILVSNNPQINRLLSYQKRFNELYAKNKGDAHQ